jgi:uncharacterized membrane protein YciS (DUF1049 family)
MKSSSFKPLLLLVAFVIAIEITAGFTIYYFFGSWSDRGTFGDMFGAVNTLFSGLAFAGVIYAIFLQRKELELQREELSLTRNELSKSASAQAKQVEQMEKSAMLSAISSTLNTYCQIVANTNPGSGSYIELKAKRDGLLSIVEEEVYEKLGYGSKTEQD